MIFLLNFFIVLSATLAQETYKLASKVVYFPFREAHLVVSSQHCSCLSMHWALRNGGETSITGSLEESQLISVRLYKVSSKSQQLWHKIYSDIKNNRWRWLWRTCTHSKWTTRIVPRTTFLIINIVGVVACISDAMNNGYQSWGRLFGKLFLLLLDHCSSLPIPHKGLRQLRHRKIYGMRLRRFTSQW